MPMLPNSSDVNSKSVNPENIILPDQDGVNIEQKKVESENFVEKKEDFAAQVIPPNDFVTQKLNQFGEFQKKARGIDVEFEQYISQKEKVLSNKSRQKQVDSDREKFVSMADKMFQSSKEEVGAIEGARKQALYGVADFAQEAVNSAIEFRNVARKAFNMSETDNVPDYAAMLPEPKTPQEEFVRSSSKFITGMLPISKGLKAITGVSGITNSVASSGIYGFLFDDKQTDGIVNEFIKENFDLAPDVLKYMNHEIDDSKFVTRLKNSANYMADDVAFEGIFYGLKMARNLSKGRNQAYKILENGDVEVKAKKVSEASPFTEAPIAINDELQRFERRSSLAFDQVPADFSSADFAPELESVRNNHWVRKTFDKAGESVLNKYIDIYENLDPSIQNMMEQYQKNQYGRNPGPVEMGGVITRGTNSLGTLVGSAVQQRLYNDTLKQIIDNELPIKAGPKTKQLIQAILDEDVNYIQNLNKLWRLPTDSGDVLKYVQELDISAKSSAGMPQWAKDIVGYRDGVVKVLKKADPKEEPSSLLETATNFVKKVVSNDFKIKGLTTEDVGKKSIKDAIDEEIVNARKEIKEKYNRKQDVNEDRLVMGRAEALAEIEKNPMSLKQLLAIPENEPVNNLIVMQAEIAQNALSRVGKRIADNVNLGKEDPELALYKLRNISEAMDKLSFPRSTSGRSLESAKFISNMDQVEKLDRDQITRLNKIFGADAKKVFDEYRLVQDKLTGFPFVDSVIEAGRKTVDPEKMWKYISAARINWILSDPTIHGANVMSNSVTMGLRVATEAVASGVSKTRALVFGDKHLALGNQAFEARATIQGYTQGLMKGIKVISDNMGTLTKEGPNSNNFKSIYSRDSNTKYNTAIDRIIDDAEKSQNFTEATLGKQFVHTMGHLFAGTPVGKMLSYEDDFFKGMHYMAEVNKQLYIEEATILRNASQLEEGADEYLKQEMDRLGVIKRNFRSGILDERIDKLAKDAANYWTFNSELVGKDIVSETLAAMEAARNQSSFIKWFIPFYRTGANITNMTLEYTPVIGGLAKMGNVGGIAGLLKGGAAQDTLMAKQVIGSMVMATAAIAMSKFEDMFGADFEMSSLKNNKVGIKMGDLQTTLDKQTPAFKIFIATRDIMDIANIAGQTEGAEAAAASAAALLMEMYSPEQMISFMGAMSEISNSRQDEIPKKMENLLKMNILSQVSPYSGVGRFINRDIRGMDKVVQGQEKDENLLDEMLKRIKHTYLGNDSDIPKRKGLFGQDIPYLRTMGYAVSDSAHDMFAGYEMSEPIFQELKVLTREDVMANPNNYDEYDLNNTTILNMPQKSITLPTGESYDMTPKEYSDFVKYSAGEHPLFKGQTLKKTLDEFIETDKYKSLPMKYKTIAIKDIVGLYRKAAKGILLNDNIDIMVEAKEAMIRIKREYSNGKY